MLRFLVSSHLEVSAGRKDCEELRGSSTTLSSPPEVTDVFSDEVSMSPGIIRQASATAASRLEAVALGGVA